MTEKPTQVDKELGEAGAGYNDLPKALEDGTRHQRRRNRLAFNRENVLLLLEDSDASSEDERRNKNFGCHWLTQSQWIAAFTSQELATDHAQNIGRSLALDPKEPSENL